MIDQIDLEDIKQVARNAGKAILEVYGTGFAVDIKEDQSPLTDADRNANQVIVDNLSRLYPDIPIISEETKTVPFVERKNWEFFWMVDPLDGTKEFVKRNGEFTVNIALVHRDTPVIGVVYQPVTRRMYWGRSEDGAWCSQDSDEPVRLAGGPHYRERDRVTVVASRSHLTEDVERFVEGLRAEGKDVEFLSAGSSLKICLVAEGAADVYPRLGPTMEWDTAAAHAVALGAGRKVLANDTGLPLVYNKENLLNPYFLVE